MYRANVLFLYLLLACSTSQDAENLIDSSGDAGLPDVSMSFNATDAVFDAVVDNSADSSMMADQVFDERLVDLGLIADSSVTMAFDAELDGSEPDSSMISVPRNAQCIADEECIGANGFCSRRLPGGACMACSDDLDCPGQAECDFERGRVCIVRCDADDDCASGLRCSGAMRCVARDCQNGQCPDARFGCSDSDKCQRLSCDETTPCPSGTVCDRSLCIVVDR